MSHYSVKLRKAGTADYDTQIREVRNQLAEQLRVFDSHLEQKAQVLQDLTDYLRRRGEIEGEYARSLDKLTDKFASKTKKKESSSESVLHCWQVLLSQTRQESKDHFTLCESFGTSLPQQLSRCLENVQRLAKKSRDIFTQLQDELLKATVELQMALKTYTQYHIEYLSAEGKLKEATKQEEKQKQSAAKKIERLIEKRQCKVQETQLKCTKARNDYILHLEAANASMNQYYLHDLSSLIDVCDIGFHNSLSQVFHFYLSSRLRTQENLGSGLQQLDNAVCGLDQNQDRHTLMQSHGASFCIPLLFQYQPHEGDQVCEVSLDCEIKSELFARFQSLQTRLNTVTDENKETSKSLETAYSVLLDWISEDVFRSEHTTSQLQETTSESSTKTNQATRRVSLQETEGAYFLKTKDNFLTGLLISKLQAKHDLLNVAIQKAGALNDQHQRLYSKKSASLRKGQRTQISQKPFSADILSYIQESGEPIPLVVESCIRFINFHGLHHEGIFRVPGSHVEINRLRDLFDKGDDPLAEQVCDMDSVAGVLKLYFRGMENPLFPKDSFDKLMECTEIEAKPEKLAQLKSVILSYTPPLIVVMRYLFAFLHHVSQYSDENMMQPYNLAVCFGPSLIRPPEDADAATLHQINALVKIILTQHETIFPSQSELEGPVYETCMTLQTENIEAVMEEPEVESDVYSNTVREELEGVALFDYTAHSAVELSFKQGAHLQLYSRASSDWWRGEINGVKGLIPSKYISVPSVEGGQDTERRISEESQDKEQQARPTVSSEKYGVSSSHALASKITLQLPQGQHPPPPISPKPLRKPFDPQKRRCAEDRDIKEVKMPVDKEVCLNMNSVFKELLTRQKNMDRKVSPSSFPSLAEDSCPSV